MHNLYWYFLLSLERRGVRCSGVESTGSLRQEGKSTDTVLGETILKRFVYPSRTRDEHDLYPPLQAWRTNPNWRMETGRERSR